MTQELKTTLLVPFIGLSLSLCAHAQLTADFELPEVKLPAIPDGSVSIVDFGAVPDGATLNTEAFEKAIQKMADQGGGRVIIPAGFWLTGPIELQSNIDLHAEKGALVLFSGDLELYRRPDGKFRHLIYGDGLKNIAISGNGVFEGAGDLWRPVKKFKMTDKQWDALLKRGGELTNNDEMWWPSEAHVKIQRPRLVRLDDCEGVLIEDATFQNSPQFALDISGCQELTIRHVLVRNAWYAQNGDGIDLHSCRNVQIIGAHVDVGDDALCMKSNRGTPLENVLIKDCVVYHGHGGFVIGSEELGGMHNVRVLDCTFMGTDVGLRFKSGRDRGGLVADIDIRNVQMIDIKEEAILFDMHYEQADVLDKQGIVTRAPDAEIPAVSETTPRFRNISIRDVICRGAARAVLMGGLPEMALQNVLMENISITANTGMVIMDAHAIQLNNVEILNETGPALHFYNARQVRMDGFRYHEGLDRPVRIQGPQNQDLELSNVRPQLSADGVEYIHEAKPNLTRGL